MTRRPDETPAERERVRKNRPKGRPAAQRSARASVRRAIKRAKASARAAGHDVSHWRTPPDPRPMDWRDIHCIERRCSDELGLWPDCDMPACRRARACAGLPILCWQVHRAAILAQKAPWRPILEEQYRIVSAREAEEKARKAEAKEEAKRVAKEEARREARREAGRATRSRTARRRR